ncbi:MAG: heavy-metal-associated domain-containing protein [Ignavibacteria bacterium]
MKTVLFLIEGMTCNHCVKAVEGAIKSLGIDNYSVQIGSASVTFDENLVDEESIKAAIEDEGYKVVSFQDETDELNDFLA